MCKSLLPKEFGSRRPQLKDAADQALSLIKWGRGRWQVKFTEYIQSSSERKNTSELQVWFPLDPSATRWPTGAVWLGSGPSTGHREQRAETRSAGWRSGGREHVGSDLSLARSLPGRAPQRRTCAPRERQGRREYNENSDMARRPGVSMDIPHRSDGVQDACTTRQEGGKTAWDRLGQEPWVGAVWHSPMPPRTPRLLLSLWSEGGHTRRFQNWTCRHAPL